MQVHASWDSEEEARAIGEEIEALQRKQHNLNDMAILVRASFQMREFEDRFVTLGLNYRVIGGPRFYERLEIRDAMAYFRLVCPARRRPGLRAHHQHPEARPRRHDRALRCTTTPVPATSRCSPAAADIIETDELKPKARKALFDVVHRLQELAAKA